MKSARFNRVLKALGDDTAATAMTASEARSIHDWLQNNRWDRIARTLAALENCDDPPPATPEISVTAGSDITEGGDAVFTVSANPVPTANLDVSVTVTQSGDYGATTGSQTVTIPTGGSYTLTVSTTGDEVDEADGSVTVTVNTGSGYTVSTSNGAATVAVSDDDVPAISISAGSDITEGDDATFTVSANPTPASALSVSVSVTQSGDYGVATGSQTVTIPTGGSYTLTVGTANDSVDETDGSVTATVNAGAGYTVGSPSAATVNVADNDDPEADDISACDPPDDAVDAVLVTSWRDGLSSSASTGIKRFNRVLEALGEDTGTGLTAMTVAEAEAIYNQVQNTRWDRISRTLAARAGQDCGTDTNDPPPPTSEISVSAGSGITEGGDATFTISANPAPTADLDVSVTVYQFGDFGAATGSQTVSIPTGGSYTLTVSTSNDSVDEPHGSVTVIVNTGSGYTVSATDASAKVTVSDDDDPAAIPDIEIFDGPDIIEGADATFTFTADPAPAADVSVRVRVTQSGYFARVGYYTVNFPAGTSNATLRVSTNNDDADESDGSINAVLMAGAGYEVSGLGPQATVAVADDDPDGQETSVTYADYYAAYADLIDKVREYRNHPVLHISKLHTDTYDEVLLALGQKVDDATLTAITASSALSSLDNNRHLFDEIAPALADLEAKGPPPYNPGLAPRLHTALSAELRLGSGATSVTVDLTDHFEDPEGEDLTFTAALTSSTATATVTGDDLTISLNTGLSRGGGSVQITASDGYLSPSFTYAVSIGCGSGASWSERLGFCTSAQAVVGQVVAATPNQPGSTDADGNPQEFPAITSYPAVTNMPSITLLEGSSGVMQARIFVAGRLDDANCRMRGYMTIEPQTSGQTIPTGLSIGVAPTEGASHRPGNTNLFNLGHPGWNDGNCSNTDLTRFARPGITEGAKFRSAQIIWNIPDDLATGTTLNPAKLVYHDLGPTTGNCRTASCVVASYDLVNIAFTESTSTVTATPATITPLTEGNSGSFTLTLSTDIDLVGYVTPRMVDIEDNGPATQANFYLSGGAQWPFIDRSNCFFRKTDPSDTAQCIVSWDFPSNGYNQGAQTVVLQWVELKSADALSAVQATTDLITLTLNDDGVTGTAPETSGDFRVALNINDQATQRIREGAEVDGYIYTTTNPGTKVVALEARHGSTESNMQTSTDGWQPVNKYAGKSPYTINRRGHRDIYLVGEDAVPCNLNGYMYSCFGGSSWQKVSDKDEWRTTFRIVSHDDNFVDTNKRWYQFSVRGATNTTQGMPKLVVEEDDAITVGLRDYANGWLRVDIGRSSFRDSYSIELEARNGADNSVNTDWDGWDVVVDFDNNSPRGGGQVIDVHRSCTNSNGGVWVRAKITAWKSISDNRWQWGDTGNQRSTKGFLFSPESRSSDHNYIADSATTLRSGWVKVCG